MNYTDRFFYTKLRTGNKIYIKIENMYRGSIEF